MKCDIFLMILNSKKTRRANPENGTCPSLSNLSSFISSKDCRWTEPFAGYSDMVNPDEGL